MLFLEEGRIEVLRAVAEEVERGHQHHEVERDFPVADKFENWIAAGLSETSFSFRLGGVGSGSESNAWACRGAGSR